MTILTILNETEHCIGVVIAYKMNLKDLTWSFVSGEMRL